MGDSKTLLIVAHSPSPNTQALCDAVCAGSQSDLTANLVVRVIPALQATSGDVLKAQALILGTPENLGYMSGALKDFFDRIYYPCLEHKRGLPYALYVRAGQSAGVATVRAVTGITTGLGWRQIQEPTVCSGPFLPLHLSLCHALGEAVAAGLEMGIF